MNVHALEITLTRPASPAEVRAVASVCGYSFAPSEGREGLTVVVVAKSREQAVKRVRKVAGALLPIDAIYTVYVDSAGMYLLSVQLPDGVMHALEAKMLSEGRSVDAYFGELVRQRLERDCIERARRLDEAIGRIIAMAPIEEILRAAVKLISENGTQIRIGS